MDFLPEQLEDYVLAHTDEEGPLLKKIHRETYAKVLMPRMLSGHLQGRVLAMFSKMIRPKRILEIGTYTGYSALCLAEGLTEDGLLYTIDINEELEDTVRGYFRASGLDPKIRYLVGNALNIIPSISEAFDLVFIDADKVNYGRYFDLVFDQVRSGGFIVADNVLWSGKVLETSSDKDTEALKNFNDKIQSDARVENVLLPVRDGLMVVRKV